MNILKLADGTIIQKLNDAVERTTGQKMVVYQEMEAPFTVYVVEESIFFGMISGTASVPVENPALTFQSAPVTSQQTISKEPETQEDNTAIMMGFLDAETYKDKIKFLEKEKSRLNSDVLELMAAGMDENIEGDDVESLYYSLVQILRTKARFEVDR